MYSHVLINRLLKGISIHKKRDTLIGYSNSKYSLFEDIVIMPGIY